MISAIDWIFLASGNLKKTLWVCVKKNNGSIVDCPRSLTFHNHIHLIISAIENNISNLLGDFKKFKLLTQY
jgi:hypothetical protein